MYAVEDNELVVIDNEAWETSGLDGAILKWKSLKAAVKKSSTYIHCGGRSTCPLCFEYLCKRSCAGCPVSKAGYPNCVHSPFEDYLGLDLCTDVSEMLKACDDEIEFLTNLSSIDFTITDANITYFLHDPILGKYSFGVEWRTKSAGYGTFTFKQKDGKIICDNEYMSREFIKSVFDFFVDKMELVHNRD